ncbi:MAG: hypothetical protein GX217_06645 [Clostridiaceae bacterium]|nr:hypothetical protein [Clostridiaceae bacterium]
MNRSPLRLNYDPHSGFHLTVYVSFNKFALNIFSHNHSYKHYVIKGIEQNWSGFYPMNPELSQACSDFFLLQKTGQSPVKQHQAKTLARNNNHNLLKETSNQLSKQNLTKLPGCEASKDIEYQLSEQHLAKLPLHVKLYEDILSGQQNPRIVFLKRLLKGKTRPIPIFVKKSKLLPSHVASGLFRRFWGIFRTGQIESFGYNWSRNFPGYAVINDLRSTQSLKQVAAHEAGHLFGLGDAYGAWYRFFYAAPNTEDYMMHYNTQVHTQEIAMLIRAYIKKKAQFFPRRFNLGNIIKSIFRELKFYFRKFFKLFCRKS